MTLKEHCKPRGVCAGPISQFLFGGNIMKHDKHYAKCRLWDDRTVGQPLKSSTGLHLTTQPGGKERRRHYE